MRYKCLRQSIDNNYYCSNGMNFAIITLVVRLLSFEKYIDEVQCSNHSIVAVCAPQPGYPQGGLFGQSSLFGAYIPFRGLDSPWRSCRLNWDGKRQQRLGATKGRDIHKREPLGHCFRDDHMELQLDASC